MKNIERVISEILIENSAKITHEVLMQIVEEMFDVVMEEFLEELQLHYEEAEHRIYNIKNRIEKKILEGK